MSVALVRAREAWRPSGLSQRIDEATIAVVDVETTGLDSSRDAIVELGIVRVGLRPTLTIDLVLESLVRPARRVGNRDVHGITNRDVRHAPTFVELAGDVLDAVSGTVLAAHNAAFDFAFLRRELAAAGVDTAFPYVCTMQLSRILGNEERSLEDCCASWQCVPPAVAHRAGADALAAAGLLGALLREVQVRGVERWDELHRLGAAAFVSSLSLPPVRYHGDLPRAALRPRRSAGANVPRPEMKPEGPLAVYVAELRSVLSSGGQDRTSADIHALGQRLSVAQLRAAHAIVFRELLADGQVGEEIDELVRLRLRRAWTTMADLGWAPGQ